MALHDADAWSLPVDWMNLNKGRDATVRDGAILADFTSRGPSLDLTAKIPHGSEVASAAIYD